MAGIEMEGFDEFQKLLEDMTLTEADERKAMSAAIKVISEQLQKDTPQGETGKLSKTRMSVKKDEIGIVGEVKTGAYWDIFQEFGTSRQKTNVGYFERSEESTQDDALKVLINELLSKAK